MNYRDTLFWKAAKKVAVDPARRVFSQITRDGRIPLMWCEGANWGDALSPVLVEMLSGRKAIHLTGLHHDRYLVIGSILGGANERAEVWGSGFIRGNERLLGKPKGVHAVRGPLSREALLAQGVNCPEVYGDPALLLPRFFNPVVEKRYAVGIIPHYIDKGHPWLLDQARNPRVKILDIEASIQSFVRDVKSCETILSSSLHGLICADSYGIPNAWIQLSDAVIGGDFKFRDYRRSICAAEPFVLKVVKDSRLDHLMSQTNMNELKIDLRKLILACPFLSSALRIEIEAAERGLCGIPATFQSSRLERHSPQV